jgi:hypothetical protein
MTTYNNKTDITTFEQILKKTKKLKTDTNYTYRIFGKPNDKLRVYMSRLADSGVIVKTRNGRFYKPKNMVAIKKAQTIVPLNKKLFSNDLFWNVKDGFKINVDTLIRSYLKEYTQDDLMGLYSMFGYTRLVQEALKIYRSRRDLNYQQIRKILMQFESWRISHDS